MHILYLPGVEYADILEEVMLPSVRAWACPEPDPITFVHDNSSVHRSRVVQQFFAEHPEIQPIQ